ncbi:MAG: uroporphyrinogen-III synthase, partial [Candidatus Hydrogenedentales bacterium]
PAETTLIFYMPVKQLAATAAALISEARPGDTPAALVQNGTLPAQRVLSGTLGQFASGELAAAAKSPAVFVVGDAAALREQLQWFESRPLHGRRVVVTRALERAAELVARLQELGADVFEFPTVEISPIEAPEPLDLAADYDWVVFTSINAVETLFDQLSAQGKDARALACVRFCAVGARTMAEMCARSLVLDAQPEDFEPGSVADALEKSGGTLNGKKVLLPRADIARSALREALEARGAIVTELRTYHAAAPRTAAALADEVVAFSPHYVTFLSASAARNFAEVLGPERMAAIRAAAVGVAIGPVAAEAVREIGIEPAVVPEVHRIPALVDALAAYDARRSEWNC